MKQPICSVIILNHNGQEFLEECLSGVMSQNGPPFEVLLVDNGSSDGSVSFVRDRFPEIRIIEANANLGYAAGNNLGVEQARSDLIVLLNNDTRVEDHWLRGLVEAIRPDNVAVASSLVLTPGYPARYYENNGTVNFLGQNIMRAFDDPDDIFYGGGASLIFKKDLLGVPFDPDYFVYGEDVYLSLRARFLGYQVRHTNESRVFHHGSGTAKKKPSSILTYYQERNRILNILIFLSPWILIRLIPFFLVNVFAKLGTALLGRRWSFRGLVRTYLWFPLNVRLILRKRRALKPDLRISEEKIIALMSGKLANGETILEQLFNRVSLTYCKLTGLKTIELAEKDNEGFRYSG